MADRPSFDDIDPELVDRYLAGEATEDEAAFVRRYLMVHPDAARTLEALVRQLDHERDRPEAPDPRQSLAGLWSRLEPSAAPASRPVARRDPRRHRRQMFAMLDHGAGPWRRRAGRIAAAAGLAIAAAAVAYRPPEPPASVQVAPEDRTYATRNGERAELRLVDGTRVQLAPASRLRVASDFGDERRDVYLEGEAYFDVAHDDRRPFTVFAGNASARDLGTAFGVRSYPDDQAVQVVVREGIVALSGVGRLAEGDLGRLTADGLPTLERGVDVDSLLGWLDGRLTFVDAPLDEVLRSIRRWHGIDVRLEDPGLGRVPFTGVLTNASADAALELVTATLGLRARRDGAHVVISAVPGRSAPL